MGSRKARNSENAQVAFRESNFRQIPGVVEKADRRYAKYLIGQIDENSREYDVAPNIFDGPEYMSHVGVAAAESWISGVPGDMMAARRPSGKRRGFLVAGSRPDVGIPKSRTLRFTRPAR